MKPEFTIEQIRQFVDKGYTYVAARFTKAMLQHYDEMVKLSTEPNVKFSTSRADICKRNEHWKECITWTNYFRCIKSCDLHKKT